MRKRLKAFFVGMLILPVFLTGCGNAGQPSNSAAQLTPGATSPAPASGPVAATNGVLASLPASAVTAILATHGGVVRRTENGRTLEQPFTFIIYEAAVNNVSYPAFDFSSTGSLGTIAFRSWLNMGLKGYPQGSNLLYTFATAVQSQPLLAESKFYLELLISVAGGNQFDPTQSKIRIMDCGLSQGVVCSSLMQDVSLTVTW